MTPPDAETLFRAFVAASRRAQATHDLGDGLAAGRAWAAFLAAFERPARPQLATVTRLSDVRRRGVSS